MRDKKSNSSVDEILDDSRRSFMKKGALVSGALAFGVGSGTVAGESNVVQPSQTLMFAYDYIPSQTLEVSAQLQQSVTRQILGQEGDDGDAIVSDTSEWNTYIASYQLEGDTPGEHVLMFTRGGQLDAEFQLGSSATFFSDEFNLLEVSIDD